MSEPISLLDALLMAGPHIVAFDTGRYLIAASLMAAIVWLLMRSDWRSRKIQARVAQSSDYRRELLLSLRTALIFAGVGVVTYWAHRNGWLADGDDDASVYVQVAFVAATVIAHDAYFYWTHRMMHHPRLFRSFHRTHHRSITPTPYAAYAFAVPEAFVMAVFMPLWLLVVPMPGVATFSFLAIMIIRNVMGHVGLELHARGWASHPLLRWVTTTTHHDLHHAGGFNHNYGFYFTFWDKLVRTEHPDYVRIYDEVTAKPERRDVPRLPGRVVMGGLLVAALPAAAALFV